MSWRQAKNEWAKERYQNDPVIAQALVDYLKENYV